MMPERGRRSRIRGVNRRRFLTGGLTALGVLGLRPGQTSSQAGAGAPKNRLTLPLVAGDSVTVETMRQLANRKGITFGLYEAVLTFNPNPHPFTPIEQAAVDNFNMIATDSLWPSERPANVAGYAEGRIHLDAMSRFAIEKGMRFRGGTLSGYRPYLPDWLKLGGFTRKEFIQLVTDRQAALLQRFRARASEWNVVNEAYHNPAGDFWLDSIGQDYVQIAFENAREHAPGVLLIYNDYDNDFPGPTRDMNVRLVSDLRRRGLIDAIGLQMHMNWRTKPSRHMSDSIKIFQDLGLAVTITECDVNMRGAPGSEAERQTLQAGLFEWVVESALEAGCRSIFLANVIDWPEWAEDATLWTNSGEPRASFHAVREVLRNA